jgi:hypothetical protein
MSKGGNTNIAETGTAASRVLFISSADATTIFNENTSNFLFVLEEPVVVPNHHSILLSVIGAEIPYSFYNFVVGRNTRLDYYHSTFNTAAFYNANGNLSVGGTGNFYTLNLPQGNWNAIELANYITNDINNTTGIPNLISMVYDTISLKFKFVCNINNNRITLGTQYGVESGVGGNDMNEELGFDLNTPSGDCFFERDAGGNYRAGSTDPPVILPGVGIDTITVPLTATLTYIYADDVADMTNSIRTLFIRSNLTTNSIQDSHTGGGFSNIMARVPINVNPGAVINVRAADGDVHKLLLKLKEFTAIHLRLTNQRNENINLNGLNYDVSLKLEFIENTRLAEPENIRRLLETSEKEESELEDIDKVEKEKTKKK